MSSANAAAAVGRRPRSSRRRRRLGLAALVVLAAAGAGAYLGVGRGGGAGAEVSPSHALAVTRFRLHAAPVAVALADGSVWVVEETNGMRASLVRLDPATGERLATFPVGRQGPDFGAVTTRDGVVWAAAGDHVVRVDASRSGAVERATLPGEELAALAAGYGSVWVAGIGVPHDTITRLDASTLAVQARIVAATQPVALAPWLGSVWLATTGGLSKIDPANNRLVPAPVQVTPVSLTRAGDRLWVADRYRNAVSIDRSGHATWIRLPFAPGAIAVSPGRVWITNNCGCRTGRVALFDARTHRLVDERPIGETPVAVAADRAAAWVASFGDEAIARVRSAR